MRFFETGFDTKRRGAQTEFRPMAGMVAGRVVAFAAAGLFMAGGGVYFAFQTDLAALRYLAAITVAFLWGVAVWIWLLRRRPLVVEDEGRVCYGKRQLCDAGSVRRVRLRHDDSEPCSPMFEAVFELKDGRKIKIPSPCFAANSDADTARSIAREIAAALKVDVVEHDSNV